jgi:hypothetical protein
LKIAYCLFNVVDLSTQLKQLATESFLPAAEVLPQIAQITTNDFPPSAENARQD